MISDIGIETESLLRFIWSDSRALLRGNCLGASLPGFKREVGGTNPESVVVINPVIVRRIGIVHLIFLFTIMLALGGGQLNCIDELLIEVEVKLLYVILDPPCKTAYFDTEFTSLIGSVTKIGCNGTYERDIFVLFLSYLMRKEKSSFNL